MRRYRGVVVLVLLLATACASAPYITLGATVRAVDLAMTGWGEYVVRNPCAAQDPPQPHDCATAAKRKLVSDAFEKYQASRRTAILVLKATDASATPAEVAAAAGSLLALIEAFTGKRYEVKP